MDTHDSADVGGVLDDAVGLVKAAFVSVLGLAFASALVRSLPYLYPSWYEVIFSGISDGVLASATMGAEDVLGALGDSLLRVLATWPIGIFLLFAVMIQMNGVANGSTIRWTRALGEAWRRVVPLVGCLGIYALALALIFGTVLVLGGLVLREFILHVPDAMLTVVAGSAGMAVSLVAVVPLVMLFIYWCLALPLVATEGLGAVGALRKSWRLVRGNWWRTLVIVSVAGFIVFAVASLAGIAGTLLVTATQGGLATRAPVVLLNAASATLTTPFLLAVLLAVLKDLSADRA